MNLQDMTNDQLQQDVNNLCARMENPKPWENSRELKYQADIRQEILTVRGVH